MKLQPNVVTHGHDTIGSQDTSSPPAMEDECGTFRKRARSAPHSVRTSKRSNLSNLPMPPNSYAHLPTSSVIWFTAMPSIDSKPKPFEVPTNWRNKAKQNSYSDCAISSIMVISHWNCRVYSANNDDLRTLLHDYNIHVFMLQAQLPEPIIFCGDFNAKHMLWGNIAVDAGVVTVERFLLQSPLTVLNTNAPTHFHSATGLSSAIDLTLVSAHISAELIWEVCDDLHGSDHWPILVRMVHAAAAPREPWYLLDKADRQLFESLTRVAIDNHKLATLSVDDLIVQYNIYITQAADLSIPKSSGLPRPRTLPWWNAECSTAVVERKCVCDATNALMLYPTEFLITEHVREPNT